MNSIRQEEILSFAKELAVRGGKVAERYFGKVSPSYKADNTPVTEADRAVEDFIVSEITKRYPDHSILGEEGTEMISDLAGPLWVIDPLDGTSAFSQFLPIWGVSVGFFSEHRPLAGAFYAPLLDDLYTATADGPARCGSAELHLDPSPRIDSNSMMLVSSDFHHYVRNRFPGNARALGSIAADICYVARGGGVAAVSGTVKAWDLGAAMLILERAGGSFRYLDGSPLEARDLLEERSTRGLFVAAHESVISRIAGYIQIVKP